MMKLNVRKVTAVAEGTMAGKPVRECPRPGPDPEQEAGSGSQSANPGAVGGRREAGEGGFWFLAQVWKKLSPWEALIGTFGPGSHHPARAPGDPCL